MSDVVIFSKSIFISKTFWINFVSILLLSLKAAIDANLPIIDSRYFIYIILVTNIINRFLTTKPVTLAGGDPVNVKENSNDF